MPLPLPGQILCLCPADTVRYLRSDQRLPDPSLPRDGGQGASHDHGGGPGPEPGQAPGSGG